MPPDRPRLAALLRFGRGLLCGVLARCRLVVTARHALLDEGIALCALFFDITVNKTATRGFTLLWQIVAGTGGLIFAIVMLSSMLSLRKVLVLEPAIVFRG